MYLFTADLPWSCDELTTTFFIEVSYEAGVRFLMHLVNFYKKGYTYAKSIDFRYAV